MSPPPLAPVNIQQIGEELAIAWNDERESFLPLEALRRACPCAACGGEPDLSTSFKAGLGHASRPHVSYAPQSFQLRSFRLIGGYALQPVWADGHDTGLYTYSYLRQLPQTSASPQ